MVLPVRIGLELAPQVVIDLVVGVLEVVLPIRGSLPDIDDRPRDRFLSHKIRDPPSHQRHLALVRALYDTTTGLPEGGIGAPEWTQYCRGGGDLIGFGGNFVFDFVDKSKDRLDRTGHGTRRKMSRLCSRFEADDVRYPLPLVPLRVTFLPHGVEELHAHHPLIRGKLDLSCKVMDVLDESRQDMPRPRGGLRAHGIDDMLSEMRIKP